VPNDANNTDLPIAKPISVQLFSRRNNKTTQLINNSKADFSIGGKHRWFEFQFEQLVFVQSVSVETEGYDDWNVVRFEFVGADGKKYENKAKNDNANFSTLVGRVAQGFRFKPDAKFLLLKSQKIKRVVVLGYTLDELAALEDAIGSMDLRETEINEKYEGLAQRQQESQQELDVLKAEIEKAEKNKSHLVMEVGQSQAQLDSIKIENSASETRNSELKGANNDLESVIATEKSELRDVRGNVSDQKNELEKIKQEIRLFPSEISGFVSEGDRNIRNYIFLSFPFVAIILYVTYSLFSNAVELTQLYKEQNISVWNIFLSRLPFVTVAVTILQVCGFAVGRR